MKKTNAKKTAARVKVDPQQAALLKFFLEDVDPAAADARIRAAVAGARAILAEPITLAFDERGDRTNPFDVVTALADGSEAVRQMHAGGGLTIDDHNDAYAVLLQHADAGVLVGAALMYELLKGVAR